MLFLGNMQGIAKKQGLWYSKTYYTERKNTNEFIYENCKRLC